MSDMTPEQIQAALDAGILTPEQARAMMKKTLHTANPDENSSTIGDEDNMRFIRGFSDVFIAVGLGLLAFGLWITAALFGGGIVFLIPAAIMALTSDHFGRRKRSHLPTLISALAFLGFTLMGTAGLGIGGTTGAALITLMAMLVYYARIRLPFCMALIALSALYVFFAVLSDIAPGLLRTTTGPVMVFAGLTIMAIAMGYDARDKHRTTRFADNAFWLHLTAAPLIIHGLIIMLIAGRSQTLWSVIRIPVLERSDAWLVLAVTGLIALFALAINRRALLISSLGYAGGALAFLISGTGLSLGRITALTLVLLGGGIVVLGAAWHPLRNQLIRFLPNWPIFPPPYDPGFKAENTRRS